VSGESQCGCKNPRFRLGPNRLRFLEVKSILLMLALAGSVASAASDPAKVAVDFVEKIRSGKIDLTPGADTALSSHTDQEKRKEISRRLSRMEKDIGGGTLEAGEVKLDDDLAAVLVRKTGGFDPSRLGVYAIALVKREDVWHPAPLPATFENAGIGYAKTLRERLAALENWMLRNQILDLEKLREQSNERMRMEIRASIDPEMLRTLSPEQIGEKFIAACGRRDLPAILGFLGGLDSVLPDDWSDRLRAATDAVAMGDSAKGPWRLLIAPEVVRVPVDYFKDMRDASLSFACLDPAGNVSGGSIPKIELVHLHFSQSSSGLWRVDPSRGFFSADEPDAEAEDDEFDIELLDKFAETLSETLKPPSVKTLEEAHEALEKALVSSDLRALLAFINLDTDPVTARRSCVRAAQIWWTTHHPATARQPVALGFHEEENSGVSAFQLFSLRDPARFDLKLFFFEKIGDQWRIVPNFKHSDPVEGAQLAVEKWADAQEKTWSKTWQNKVLSEAAKLTALEPDRAPDESLSRKVIGDWLDAIRRGDAKAALRQIAYLDNEKSIATALQNIGYEISNAQKYSAASEITQVFRGKDWIGVGVRQPTDTISAHPFFPVVATPTGPRILIEVDLFAIDRSGSGTRGREFLNKNAFARLDKLTRPEIVEELRTLFSKYQSSLNP
jgi:hypothetical protein